ncbi:MAG: hypothetical protein FJ029_11670 [Actinobacteria bacterium]|nr:hypothetical protein [Actinomycetota bacterium]
MGALIVAIDRGGGSLNSEQRAKALALLKQAGENIKQEGDAIVAIYQALTEAQRASLATASMQPITPSSTSGPPQPGRDFLVEQVIEVVGKKAGGESKAVTPSPAASPQPVLQDRYPVLAGVYGIQSKGGLSDDQAKAIMGYLITLRVLAEKQYQIETELSALFTADQMALRQRTSFRDRGTVYTTLLSRYLEAGK